MGRFFLRIPESWALESGIQLKESKIILLTIRIGNPSYTARNPESKTVLEGRFNGSIESFLSAVV